METRDHHSAVGATRDVDPATDFAMTVVKAVAEAKSVDPFDLPPLGFEVDFDALQALVVGMADRPVEIRFNVANCLVVVDGRNVRAYHESPP